MIIDITQNNNKHLTGRTHFEIIHGQKDFTIQLNQIEMFVVLYFQTCYFDIHCFKKIITCRVNEEGALIPLYDHCL